MEKRKKSGKSKRWLIGILIAIIVIVLAIASYGASIYFNAKNTVNKRVFSPVASIDTELVQKKVEEKQPLNILLLGVDQRANDRGRSDALMVLSLAPENNSATLVSIPRDTRTEIVGRGTEDKINHAYAFGGPDMSVATVENLLDIELDYFVRVNMEGLAEIVDVLDGITVDNEIAFNDFSLGSINLNGTKTLEYVRMRKQDPRGDFGRTERQRKVIKGIIDKGANMSSVTKINDLIDVLGKNMSTNMKFDDMKDLMFNYKDTRQNFNTYQLQGTGTTIGGIYYMTVTDAEVNKVHDMLVKK